MLSSGMTRLLATVHCMPLCQHMPADACVSTEMQQTCGLLLALAKLTMTAASALSNFLLCFAGTVV